MTVTTGDVTASLAVRRQLSRLHDALRAEGHNPLEAAHLLAAALSNPAEIRSDLREVCIDLRSQAADSELLAIGFQEFITSEARNGLGQYLTPPHVCDFMAELLARDHPELAEETLLDPFSGVGILIERIGTRLGPGAKLRGFEVNPAIHSAAQAMCELSVADLEIERANSFDLLAEGTLPSVGGVATNPPFGSAVVGAADALRQVLPPSLSAMKRLPAELLGIEVSLAALRPGGVLAIVLPQSVLTNSGWSGYRADLFRRLRLEQAVSLPEQTFGPFKGVARACVLVGRKEGTKLPATASFVRSHSAGYDETGRPVGRCDLDDVVDALRSVSPPALTIEADGAVKLPPTVGSLESAVRLGDFAEVFNGRAYQGKNDGSPDPAGAFSLQVGDLRGAFVSWVDRGKGRIPQAFFAKNKRAQLREGDICMTAAAHKPRYVGLKVDLLDEVPPEGAMPSPEVLTIRVKSGAPFTPFQLLVFLRSPLGYQQIQELVRGSTAHLYAGDVQEMLIPDLSWVTDDMADAYEEARVAFRRYLELERKFLTKVGASTPPHAAGNG